MYQLLGTAVHEHLESVFMRDELRRASRLGASHTKPRWHIERRVVVGAITDPRSATERRSISGSCDLYTPDCGGVVIDWKLKGRAGIDAMRRSRVPPIMRHQLNLYGLGLELAGEPVAWVVGYGLPRVGGRNLTMADAAPVVMPYDRDDALATLARADSWARVIATYGTEAALSLAGEHTGAEFSCTTYGNATTPSPAPARSASVIDLAAVGREAATTQ